METSQMDFDQPGADEYMCRKEVESIPKRYPSMAVNLGGFKLSISRGSFEGSEIIALMGVASCGKTTFLRMLAGTLEHGVCSTEAPPFNVSFKPEIIKFENQSTVHVLLQEKIADSYNDPQFVADVINPLKIQDIVDQEVHKLSGGELQKLAIVLCLGKPANVYLIDSPSTYLDAEQRLVIAKVIKRFIFRGRKTAFVVEEDITMATYLADRVIVFEGRPSVECNASAPQALFHGTKRFLELLGITFRIHPRN